MRWTLLTALAAAGAADARRDRRPSATATTPPPAASAPPRPAPPGRPRRPRPTRGRKASSEDGLANQIVEAVGIGFGRAHDPQLLAPYVERYHAVLLDVVGLAHARHRPSRSSAASTRCSLAEPQLADATQAWLDAHADAPAGLRRLVAENRDAIARALAAQERDAARG